MVKNIVGFSDYEIIFSKNDVVLSIDKVHGTQYSKYSVIENKLKIEGDVDNVEINIESSVCFELNKYNSIVVCEIDRNKIKAQEVFYKI